MIPKLVSTQPLVKPPVKLEGVTVTCHWQGPQPGRYAMQKAAPAIVKSLLSYCQPIYSRLLWISVALHYQITFVIFQFLFSGILPFISVPPFASRCWISIFLITFRFVPYKWDFRCGRVCYWQHEVCTSAWVWNTQRHCAEVGADKGGMYCSLLYVVICCMWLCVCYWLICLL